jgi:hypothetical protein
MGFGQSRLEQLVERERFRRIAASVTSVDLVEFGAHSILRISSNGMTPRSGRWP